MVDDGKLSYVISYIGKDVSNYVLDINEYLTNNTSRITILNGDVSSILSDNLESNGLLGS